jgi:hypothetical protein
MWLDWGVSSAATTAHRVHDTRAGGGHELVPGSSAWQTRRGSCNGSMASCTGSLEAGRAWREAVLLRRMNK